MAIRPQQDVNIAKYRRIAAEANSLNQIRPASVILIRSENANSPAGFKQVFFIDKHSPPWEFKQERGGSCSVMKIPVAAAASLMPQAFSSEKAEQLL